MFKLSLLSTALLLSSTTFANTSNTAESDIERVVVYGTLDNTPLLQTAASVSVLNTSDIKSRQAQHLETLFNKVPNLNFSSGASRGRFVQIRGIGERSQFVDPINPSVGFLVDGIDYSGLMAGASTFDVAQIEVFKGPNSARFGAEGLAGMINVITEQASSDLTGQFDAGIANYGAWHMGAAAGGEITDGINGRVSAHTVKSDGFVNNIHLDREDTNNIDETTLRAKISAQLSSDTTLGVALHKIDVDNGYDAFSLDQNRDTLSDEPGFDTQDSTAVAITADYRGLESANLSLKLTSLDADLGYGYDEDWSFVDIHEYGYSSTDHYYRDHNDVSAEVKLQAKDLTWSVGTYFAEEDESLERQYTWLSQAFNSKLVTTDATLFGKYKFLLSDTHWVSVSGRLAQQDFEYSDNNDNAINLSDNSWGGEVSYHQMLSSDTMAYVSLQRSYKMGGVNSEALSKAQEFPLTAGQNSTFSPETLMGLEAGVKGQSVDGRVRYLATAFHQSRENVQYRNWINEDQSFVGYLNNAAKGTNSGIEVEVEYDISDTSVAFANVGLLSTSLDGITREGDDGVEDISGRDQAHAPAYQLNTGVNFIISDAITATVEMDAKDNFYYSYSHDEQSDDIVLLHANVTYAVDNWQVSVYARNLTDETYGTRGFFFGNDPRDGYEAKLWQQLAEPMRVGVNVNLTF